MIFVTLGTQLPFNRLVEAIDVYASKDNAVGIFGQIADPGPGGYEPTNFEWVKFLDPSIYQKHYAEADIIVAHAGMGSIITALTSGKPIIIMPRKASLGEHRNEHQLATAEKFQDRKGIYVAWETKQLGQQIDQAYSDILKKDGTNKASPYADPQLISAIRDFIHND